MKNANGEGTIKMFKGHRKRPYAAVITVDHIQYYDDTGFPIKTKQKFKYIGWYEKRTQAVYALSQYRHLHPAYTDQPTNEEPSQIKEKQPVFIPTFEQMWNITKKTRSSRWAQRTAYNYDHEYEFCDDIKNLRMDELDYQILQHNMDSYMKTGKTEGCGKLHKVFLTMIFREAIKCRYISNNQASFVSYKGTKDSKLKTDLKPKIIKNIYHSTCKTRDICMILIYTGMRIEELMKVKESNVYYEDHYMISGEKTDAGKRRIIPIHPAIDSELHRFFSDKERTSYTKFRNQLVLDCATYGMEFTSHYCRHTFITMAKHYGIDEYTKKRIVGHKTKDVTDNVYTHYDVEDFYKAVCQIPYPDEL